MADEAAYKAQEDERTLQMARAQEEGWRRKLQMAQV
jgi:hypothetical protein